MRAGQEKEKTEERQEIKGITPKQKQGQRQKNPDMSAS